MSRERFTQINKYIHANDNEEDDGSDSLHKMRPIIDHLQNKFETLATPKNGIVSLDEILMGFYGRWKFKQYISSKRHKHGIKIFLAVDSSFVIHSMYIYHGTLPKKDGFSKTETLVLDMVSHLGGKNMELYTDNYFNSPKLAVELLRRKIRLHGTMKKNR